MQYYILSIIVGFVALVWAADRFVYGAAGLARALGIAPMVIGLTVVGFGTSAPEMVVSGIAAWGGNPALGIGNAIGSNITNIALVVGATAMVMPLAVRSETLRREFPILFSITLIAAFLLFDQDFSRLDGTILVLGFVVVMYAMVHLGLKSRTTDPMIGEFTEELPPPLSLPVAFGWIALGIVALLASSRLVVWGAVGIATEYGISDLIIGLTIIAIGTSLPELAASLVSAFKKEHDIAVGNVLGSNMFNLLAVLGLPGLIQPSRVESALMVRDLPVMALLTVLLFVMATRFTGAARIGRIKGGLLLLCFIAYEVMLYIDATASRAAA